VLGCLDYFERLQQRSVRPVPAPPEPPAKPEGVSPEETQRWLEVFREADEQDGR
jgi:hypothetical protein